MIRWFGVPVVIVALAVVLFTTGDAQVPLAIDTTSTGVAKLEDGDVVCVIEGIVVACFNAELPASMRKTLGKMLTRGFEAPPKIQARVTPRVAPAFDDLDRFWDERQDRRVPLGVAPQ